jgi:hypothetical protein
MPISDIAAALAALRSDLADQRKEFAELRKEVGELRERVAQGIGGMRVLTWMLHAAGFLAATLGGWWLGNGGKH